MRALLKGVDRSFQTDARVERARPEGRHRERRLGLTPVSLTSNGRIVCERCLVADRPFGRMKGLLGRRSLASGEGLLLRPASSVHTFFMRFPIDVVFLDRDLRVLSIARDLRPWRAAGRPGARAALELPAGECERRGLQPGDTLLAESAPHFQPLGKTRFAR